MTPADRKEQILEAAQELLQTQGYAGFSYSDLSARLGIAKPSIHHHFATKEALGLALIERYGEMVEELAAEFAQAGDDPTGQLQAFLAYGEKECLDQEHAICPGGALHSDYEVFPESMQAATRELSGRMHAWFADLLRRGREQSQFHFEGTPEEEAWAVMSTLQGARQHSRTHGPEIWRMVVRQIERSLLVVAS